METTARVIGEAGIHEVTVKIIEIANTMDIEPISTKKRTIHSKKLMRVQVKM